MMETATQPTATLWQVWVRSPGEQTWRHSATYPFQVQAEIICQRIIERFGDEAKVEAVPRA
jgi:hypothetical protein